MASSSKEEDQKMYNEETASTSHGEISEGNLEDKGNCSSRDRKLHKCGFCEYETNFRNDLENHIRTHTGEKPYKCDFCNYSAAIKSSLVLHKRLHTGEKPFLCDKCGKLFSRSSSFIKHIRRSHVSP